MQKPRVNCRWLVVANRLLATVVLTIGCTPNEPDEVHSPDSAVQQQPTDVAEVDVTKDGDPASEEASDTEPSPHDLAIDRAISYLLSQQSDDGGIKSKAYGVLRPGAATTALALYGIAHVDGDQPESRKEKLQRANEFLLQGLTEHGKVAAPDGTLDYPTYGAALWLIADERLHLGLTGAHREQLTQWILDAQLTEAHEITEDNIQFGGWDLEAASGAKGDQLKGTNISITSFALEALQGSMQVGAEEALTRAKGWVDRCQNKDGGYVFHVWRPHPGNKAMWTDDAQTDAISYATPTCDGLRCLIYCGATAKEDAFERGVDWLAAHSDVKHVPGFEAKAKEAGWREGLRFYYYFTQAKLLPHLPEAEAKRRAALLKKILLAQQREDGSFQNDQPRMFEDDPILATSLALIVLAETR